MEDLYLERPSFKHKEQYESMMNEWETYGGRLNRTEKCNLRKMAELDRRRPENHTRFVLFDERNFTFRCYQYTI